MEPRVRWGFIGVGSIAAKVASDLAHAPGAVLHGAASRDRDRARAFVAAHGGAAAYDTIAALLADQAIDAVYIATPNTLHRAHALMAIEAGKAVLVEKPFALNAAEAREIAAAAHARGVFCMEAMWTRFLPAIQACERALRDDRIGAPLMLSAEVGFTAPADPTSHFHAVDGGGALLDLGVYAVSMAHLLFGKPQKVHAKAIIGAHGADVHTSALLTWRDKAAQIAVSHKGPLSNAMSIAGERGRIDVRDFIQARALRTILYGAPAPAGVARDSLAKTALKRLGVWPLARAIGRAALGRDGRAAPFPFPGMGYQFQMIEAGARLAAGRLESAIMPLAETIAVMETLDAIRAAALSQPTPSAPSAQSLT